MEQRVCKRTAKGGSLWKHGKLWEGVPFETARTQFVSHKAESIDPNRRKQTVQPFSTTIVPFSWNRLRKRCVSCVSSSVELRKRELSAEFLRTRVLRPEALSSVAFVYPQKSPKSTLKGVFERMQRTARTKKCLRMSERFAPRNPFVQRLRPQEFAFPPMAEIDLACPGRRVRVSEVDALRRNELAFVAGRRWRRPGSDEE